MTPRHKSVGAAGGASGRSGGAGAWRLVEEVFCERGDTDRAIREFDRRHPELTAHPKRLRVEVLCHRESQASTVRFLWDEGQAQ